MVDFHTLLKNNLIEHGLLEKSKINTIRIKTIIACDETNHTFEKQAELIICGKNEYSEQFGRYILSFGGFTRYYLSSLKDRNYPYPAGKEFCIDIGGRNHFGSPVSIKTEDMNTCIQLADEIVDLLKTFEINDEGYFIVDRCQTCLGAYAILIDHHIEIQCECHTNVKKD